MSRYTIAALDPALTAVIGWDGALNTHFAIVIDDRIDEEDEYVRLYLGTQYAEIPRAEDLVAPLAPYAVVTDDHIARLRADRAGDHDRGPSPPMRQLLNLTRQP
jgi:hypothetical protein